MPLEVDTSISAKEVVIL